MKRIGIAIKYILLFGIGFVAFCLVCDRYQLNIADMLLFLALVLGLLIFHEVIHALVGICMGMQLVFIQVLNIILIFDKNKISIKIKKIPENGFGMTCVLPTWSTTVRQWVGMSIAPYLITLVILVVLWIGKMLSVFRGNIISLLIGIGVVYCLGALIPFEGTDIRTLLDYFFDSDRIKRELEYGKFAAAFIRNDLNCIKLEESIERVNEEKAEVKNYLESIRLRYLIVLLDSMDDLQKKRCHIYFKKFYEEGSIEYKRLYCVYLTIIGTETQEIQTLIQRDCISIHEEDEDCILLQILLGKNNNLKTLENVLKSQAYMEIYQLAGQKEAFQGYREAYVELAKKLITYNRNRDGKI